MFFSLLKYFRLETPSHWNILLMGFSQDDIELIKNILTWI